MNKTIISLLSILSGVLMSLTARTDAHYSKPQNTDSTNVVNVNLQLVEIPPLKIPECGFSLFANTYKFKVADAPNKENPSEILVAIPCPLSYGKDFFIAGNNYKVSYYSDVEKAKESKSETFALTNSYEKENRVVYWIKEIGKVK